MGMSMTKTFPRNNTGRNTVSQSIYLPSFVIWIAIDSTQISIAVIHPVSMIFCIRGKRKWLESPHRYKILPDLLGDYIFWGQPEFYSYTLEEGTLLVKKPVVFSSLSPRLIEIRLLSALFWWAFAVFSFINFLAQRLERVETQMGFVFIEFFATNSISKNDLKSLDSNYLFLSPFPECLR